MNGFKWTEYTTRSREGYFDKWKWIQVKNLPKLREIRDRDVYRSVWTWEEKDHSSPKIGDFHMDFDSDTLEESQHDAVKTLDSLEKHYGVDLEALSVGFSGSKGFFIIIPHECFLKEPIEQAEDVYKMLGEFFKLGAQTLDTSIYIKRRMWRLTNSIHQKSGLFRIELRPHELRELCIEEIKKKAAAPRWVNHKQPVLSEELHGIILKIQGYGERYEPVRVYSRRFDGEYRIPKSMRRQHDEGGRNYATCQLVGKCEAVGLSYAEAEALILEFNRLYCNPPEEEDVALRPLKYYYGK